MFAYAAGARSLLSREGSAGSRSSAWWEKERVYEPYADEAALMAPGPAFVVVDSSLEAILPAHPSTPLS